MNDITRLADLMREFAVYKQNQAKNLTEWKPGMVFRSNTYEKSIQLKQEAEDLQRYAEEMKRWWNGR